jgi:hypothetical protein
MGKGHFSKCLNIIRDNIIPSRHSCPSLTESSGEGTWRNTQIAGAACYSSWR